MNKKYISLILLLMLIITSFNTVYGADIGIYVYDAVDSYELQTKENLGKYFSSSDTKWQGACIADKYIVICAINSKDNGNIYVFDKNGTNIAPKCKVPVSNHHCNSITYDSKRSLLIVSTKEKQPMLFELNKSTGEIVKKDFTFKQTEKLSNGTISNPTTIAYDADTDSFVVLYSYASKFYIYSSTDFYNNNKSTDVKMYSCEKYSSSYYCQQATIYNSFLFYTINKQENGKLNTYIYVYDLLDNGVHVDTLIENKSTYEVEGATFDLENGSMYIFYINHNGDAYKKFALYKTNISGSRYTRFVATFNGNGGSKGKTIMKYGSKALGTLPTSTRKGYTFDGWYTKKDGGTKINSKTILSANTTFYAHWIPITYKITYDLDGGSGSNSETYSIESKDITLNKPTKTGYTFLGWTGSNGNKAQLNVTISKGSTGDKNYKANWKVNEPENNTETTPESFVATFNGNGGSNGKDIKKYGSEALGTLPTSTRKGYTFDGWYTKKDGGTKINSKTILSANTTFYAHWIPITYKITYDLDGGSASNSETYSIESKDITLNKPTKTGYTFLGWTGSNGNKAQLNVTISKGSTGDKNYKANWKVNEPENNTGTTHGGNTGGSTTENDKEDEEENINSYQIKVIKATGGKISPSTVRVEEGKNKTFKIVPNEGYIIDDVIVDGESVGSVEEYTFEKINKKHTITAVFVEEASALMESFGDVTTTDWYYDAVKYAVGNHLFNGISEKEFAPNAKMTRGMLVTVLYRLSESKFTEKSTFNDVPQNSYYSSAIAWANDLGIVNGVGNNNFAPDKAISREDVATIINRYITKNKIRIKVQNNVNKEYLDKEQISSYAFESVEQLKKYGLMTGKSGNYFEPKGLTTRAEVATILMRIANKKK